MLFIHSVYNSLHLLIPNSQSNTSLPLCPLQLQVCISESISVSCYQSAKSLQSCLTLCDPIHGSPPGSPVPGILQARTLEWVAISFFNAWKWKVKVKSLSRARLLATPWTAAHQAPLSMGFPRQEYWSGVPLPSLLILPSLVQRRVSFWAHIYSKKISHLWLIKVTSE